ncbi:MAG TPA: hypothetical protein VFW00_14555 [Rhodocyclaceae bacterium]|nr:hypothetical protein [Rhodocyclaceae bacterium]
MKFILLSLFARIGRMFPRRTPIANLLIAVAALAMFPLPSSAATGAQAESWLGLPVTFKDRGYALHPWPAIELQDLKILTAEAITVNHAWVSPDWAEWITTAKTSRLRLQADQIVARPAALARLGLIDGKSTRKLTSVRFAKLKLLIGTGSLDLPAGEMEFAPDGTLRRIKMQLGEKVTIDAVPKDGKLNVTLNTGQWKWEALPVFTFDNLVAEGEISDDQILFDRIGANADGGVVSGVIHITVPDKFALDGEIKLNGVDARDVLGRLYPRHTVLGNLYAVVKLASSADSFDGLGKELTTSGSYEIREGSIDRMGLMEGLHKVGPGPAGGGLTRFVKLTGTFSGSTQHPASVSIQHLDGGAMQGSGGFTVTSDGNLKGSMAASMRMPTGETTSRSMALTGSVDAPTLTVR